jgi:hypothetical protein
MHTEKANTAMRSLLNSARGIPDQLDTDLASYLNAGFVIEPDGSVVSAASGSNDVSERASFNARVDYEAFVNKIHIEDWGSEALWTATTEEMIGQALVLADAVGNWAKHNGVTVAVIVSADPDNRDVVFRFHGVRPAERPWLHEDLEGYAEPVLLRIYGDAHN